MEQITFSTNLAQKLLIQNTLSQLKADDQSFRNAISGAATKRVTPTSQFRPDVF